MDDKIKFCTVRYIVSYFFFNVALSSPYGRQQSLQSPIVHHLNATTGVITLRCLLARMRVDNRRREALNRLLSGRWSDNIAVYTRETFFCFYLCSYVHERLLFKILRGTQREIRSRVSGVWIQAGWWVTTPCKLATCTTSLLILLIAFSSNNAKNVCWRKTTNVIYIDFSLW